MTRKVLIASTNPWWFAMAVERDIVRLHAGDQIDLVDLFSLFAGRSPHWRRQDRLIERVNRKIARFVRPLINGRDITSDIKLDEAAIAAPPDTIEGMREYRVGGARVGLAVLSSITSLTTIRNPVSVRDYGRSYPEAWVSAHLAVQAGEAVAKLGYDAVYIFNGRHCYSRPFCDVLDRSAQVWRYEQGATGASYIMDHRILHEPKYFIDVVLAHDFDAAEGAAFYEDRLRRAPGDPVNLFTSGQVAGRLPAELAERKLVTFFTSSSDELFAATDEATYGDFEDQYAVALGLAQACRKADRTMVIRMHPHLMYKHESWRSEWDFERLAAEGAVLIWPEDSCDSYALSRASESVITCGSTLGIECGYLGIPAAEVGYWLTSRLGACATVSTQAELEAFVAAPALPPGAHDRALIYGSFVRRAGKPLPEVKVGAHPNFATIDGRIVDPVRALAQRLRSRGKTGKAADDGGSVDGKVILDPSMQDIRRKLEGAKSEPAA